MAIGIGDLVETNDGFSGEVVKVTSRCEVEYLGVKLDHPEGRHHTLDGFLPDRVGWYYSKDALTLIEKSTKEETEMNPIFSYRASDSLQGDAWKELAKGISDANAFDIDKATMQFTVWEKEYKDEVNMPLPGAWRSAKSVIKNAIKRYVPIVNPEGTPFGKSYVEAKIKEANGRVVTDPSLYAAHIFARDLEKLIAYAKTHGIDWVAAFKGEL